MIVQERTIRELRELASAGAPLIALFSAAHEESDVESFSSRIVVTCLFRAFTLSVEDLRTLSCWEGFNEGGHISFERIEELYKERVSAWLAPR